MKKQQAVKTAYVIVFFLVVLGVTSAWFAQRTEMSTLLAVDTPDNITISDADGSDMTELDLDFREGVDTKDADGKVTVLRPVCIKSSSQVHQLEIVHTTNLESLSFRLFATDDGLSTKDLVEVTGSYVNKASGEDLKAKVQLLENYQEGDDVNGFAYPLYWMAKTCGTQGTSSEVTVKSYGKQEFDVASKSVKTFYYTYYYLEISWKEPTKETDLFYIMARTVA